MHAFMMQLWEWLAGHPPVAAGCAGVLAVLLWKQPRQTAKLLVALAVLVALGYAVTGLAHFAMHGVSVKEQMINPQ